MDGGIAPGLGQQSVRLGHDNQHDWADVVWQDPDGSVLIHGTIPTVVYPNAMRPRNGWHGLALLESPDVVDLWQQEEADEAESQGINMTHALLSGGAFGKYAEGISTLEDIQGGRFPDPEPRRLQRNAVRHDRPVFFIEPLADVLTGATISLKRRERSHTGASCWG